MRGPRCRVAKNRAGWHRSLPKDLRGSDGLEESSRRRGLCSEIGDGEQLPRGFSGPKDGFPCFLALSSRSYPVQLLWEAANWCPRRPLRFLGFDLKRQKFRRHGRLFIGVSVLSRRGFHCEAVLIFQSNSFPRWLGLIRWGRRPGCYELGRAVTVGSVTTSSQLGQLGRPVACQAACDGVPSSRYAGCAQGRDPTSGWAGEEVSAHDREEK
jgi:hypothetical protein